MLDINQQPGGRQPAALPAQNTLEINLADSRLACIVTGMIISPELRAQPIPDYPGKNQILFFKQIPFFGV